MKNSTLAAAGKLSKGIIRTPPDDFLNSLAVPFVFSRAWPGEPPNKGPAFDWAFDEMPI